MATIQYNIDILKNGRKLADLSSCDSFSYNFELNNIADAKFSLILSDNKFDLSLNDVLFCNLEIEIKRNQKLIWSGIITEISDNYDNTDQKINIEISASQFGYLLDKKRYTKTDKKRSDSWVLDMIQSRNLESLDNLGFTFGEIEEVEEIAKTYKNDEILKTIKQITELQIGSLDFVIGNTLTRNLENQKKEISLYKNLGQIRNTVFTALEFGNIINIKRIQNSKKYANKIIGVGKDDLIYLEKNLNEIEKNGLYEDVISLTDISNLETLKSHVQKELAIRSRLEEVCSFGIQNNDPQFGQYECGDFVKIEVKSSRININEYFRIYQISCSVDNSGSEKIDLVLAREEPSKSALNRARGVNGLVENLINNFSKINNKIYNLEK